MAYKDKEKQRQANKEAAQRRRDKAKGMTKGRQGTDTSVIPERATEIANVIPKTKPEDVVLEGITMTEFHRKCAASDEMRQMKDDIIIEALTGKPKAHDPAVQEIWDRRNAQGQAGGYSHEAKPKDYPQTQRPMT